MTRRGRGIRGSVNSALMDELYGNKEIRQYWEDKMKTMTKILYFLGGLLLPVPVNLLVDAVNEYVQNNFLSLLYPITVSFLISFFLGIYLGLYNFLKNVHKKGKWHLNKILLIMGIVFFVLSVIITYPIILDESMLIRFSDRFYIWVTVSGFLLMSSFQKTE